MAAIRRLLYNFLDLPQRRMQFSANGSLNSLVRSFTRICPFPVWTNGQVLLELSFRLFNHIFDNIDINTVSFITKVLKFPSGGSAKVPTIVTPWFILLHLFLTISSLLKSCFGPFDRVK